MTDHEFLYNYIDDMRREETERLHTTYEPLLILTLPTAFESFSGLLASRGRVEGRSHNNNNGWNLLLIIIVRVVVVVVLPHTHTLLAGLTEHDPAAGRCALAACGQLGVSSQC